MHGFPLVEKTTGVSLKVNLQAGGWKNPSSQHPIPSRLETEPSLQVSLSRAEKLGAMATSSHGQCIDVGLARTIPNLAFPNSSAINLGLGPSIIGTPNDSWDHHNGDIMSKADCDPAISSKDSVDSIAQSTRNEADFQIPMEVTRENLEGLNFGQDGPIDGTRKAWITPRQ